ncbi:MAG: hypothetical protein GZ091_00205 [Paludibacter sp.]|nr:hypothetical protein [Paludibacter sp.]
MKTKIFSFVVLGLSLILIGCETIVLEKPAEPLKKELFSGYVQKGPFINGSSVIISELDTLLDQTGRSYSTTVSNNSGSFEQKKIELVSKYVQLKADGYYFNEVSGESSTGQLTLYALADVSVVNSANINVLTHLEKSRVEYLVQENKITFAAAKKQAQTEVLQIFNLTLPSDSTSESLNLSGNGEDNAILLAVSCILQGQLSTADMSELMANIIADIKTDGKLDDASLGSAMINNAKFISLPSVREHLVAKYTELGLNNVKIPDFESKVQEFISKTIYTQTKMITYPDRGDSGINILSDSITSIHPRDFYSSTTVYYSMTANLPQGTSLRVVLKGSKWYYRAIPVPVNWTVGIYDESSKVQEFSVNKNNTPNDIAMLFDAGTVTIEYYENGAITPTRVKQLNVSDPAPIVNFITYPLTGKAGENILNDSLQITRSGKVYSIKAEVPQGKSLRIVLKGGTWVLTDFVPLNWTIGTYNTASKSQEFTVTDSNKPTDMSITFTSSGTYTVEYYENGAIVPTRIRQFIRS